MAEHLDENHFYCGECLLSFTCPFLVPIHFQVEHEFRCVCEQRFSDRFGLLTHMENVGCRFPFSIEVSKPTVAQPSTTDKKSKLAVPRSPLANGVFDAVSACIRKTDNGFVCSICEKICSRRYRLWQHVRKSHSDVLKKMASRHLKTVIQKFCAMVGEVLVCTVCGKPYLKQWNLYEHFCVEHTLQISKIDVHFAEVEEQDFEQTSAVTVLSNHLYAKVKEGKYRCLICKWCCLSLRAVANHLRKHGKQLKECLDKIVMAATLSRRKKISIGSSRNVTSDKFNVENAILKTRCDGSGLDQKSSSNLRSEVVVKRPEQELEFLRGYIVKNKTVYYCQLCPTKSTRKGYLYQHLAIRHDDILGETLLTFRQNEGSMFQNTDSSGSIHTTDAQYSGTGTPSLGNVVGNVEFHTDVWALENNGNKTTGSVLFNKSREQNPLESLSVADQTSFQRLAVSQDSYLECAIDHGHVPVDHTDNRSSSFARIFPDAALPGISDGKQTPFKRGLILQPACSDGVLASAESCASDGGAVGRNLTVRKKPRLLLSKGPAFSGSVRKHVSDATRAFCVNTGAYVCTICNHKLATKSGWYKHFKQCRVGGLLGRNKKQSFASKRSKSDDQVRQSASGLVDSQRGSATSVVLKTSDMEKKGDGQKLWRCVACQFQFISYSRWQRHFVSCQRKRLTVRKRRRFVTAENEFLRKNCRQKGQRFACRMCGLDYRRIYDAFHHIRQKHVTTGVAGLDDTNSKLDSVIAQSTANRSPARVKSGEKCGKGRKSGENNGAVNPGRKSAVVDAASNRHAYVRSQVREENGRSFCNICDKSFLLRTSARKHINRLHLGLYVYKQSPATRLSPVSHNVASSKINILKGKVVYKPRSKNLTNGSKAFMKGAKLKKTEVGSVALVKSCGLCSKRFLSLHSLSAHVASEHMTIETTPYPCVKCPRSFERRQYCVRHFVHTHCHSVKNKQVGKKFHCKICNIYFPKRSGRLQHLSEVHADVCEVCSFCSALFLTKPDLLKHTRVHSAKISNASEGQISRDVLQNQGASMD